MGKNGRSYGLSFFMSQNNKRKLWGCPKTSLLILNEYLTEQTCKQSVVVLRIHDAKPDVLVV